MRKILKKLDHFAISPTLNIGKESKYQSYSGGIASIIVFVLVFLTAINFSQNLFFKKNPSIVISQKNFAVIPSFDLSNYKLGYFFNGFYMGKLYDPTILTFSAGVLRSFISLNGTQEFRMTPLELEKCTLDRYQPFDDKEILSRLNMDNNVCFTEKESKNLKLEGGWGQSEFSMIYVDIGVCKNSTLNR
jgi:hypothetical protein